MRKRPFCLVCVGIITMQIFLLVAGIRKMVPATDTFNSLEEKQVHALGCIYKKETSSNGQILYLKDVHIQHQNHKLENIRIIVYNKQKRKFALGNKIFVSGKLRFFDEPRNFGNYNSKFYYEKQGILISISSTKIKIVSRNVWLVRNWLETLREKCDQSICEVLGKEKGKIISAILLGEKREISSKWKELYQVNGIGHILAISGLHLSFIGTLFYSSFRKMGWSYKSAGGIVIVLMTLYVLMTGAAVSTLRALIMLAIKIGADITGRVYDLATSLSISAIIVICWRPQYLFDSGFLFSFGAVLGILLLKPILEMLFPSKKKWVQSIYASLAIQLFLIPITLYFFFEIPTYAFFLNMVIIPVMSLLLGMAVVGMLLIYIWKPFGTFVLKGSGIFVTIYNYLCEWILELPKPRIVLGKPEWWQVVLFYFTLIIYILYMQRKGEKEDKTYRKRILFFSIFMIVIPHHFSSGKLEIDMLDVGQGDGIFLCGPQKNTYFIDGGSSDVKQVGKYRIEPFLKAKGVKTLNYVFISHGDLDHLSGIDEMLERQKIGVAIENLVLPVKEVWDETLTKLANKALRYGTKVFVLGKGERLKEGEMELECVFPDCTYNGKVGNESSMVLSLQYRKFDALFTGDIEGEGEEELQNEIKQTYDVLKVAHHGSKHSTKKEVLDKVGVKIAIISSGRKNSYGHPHKELLKRLEEKKIKVYATKEKGCITINTDGKKMELECYLFPLQKN
ncbi:DNA internalization-related competence protein ComEC/Rec2 [Faecalimonas sp.]